MENEEGKQQEEKAQKNRETDRCSVSELQQKPGVDIKKEKKEGKEIWLTEKKI